MRTRRASAARATVGFGYRSVILGLLRAVRLDDVDTIEIDSELEREQPPRGRRQRPSHRQPSNGKPWLRS